MHKNCSFFKRPHVIFTFKYLNKFYNNSKHTDPFCSRERAHSGPNFTTTRVSIRSSVPLREHANSPRSRIVYSSRLYGTPNELARARSSLLRARNHKYSSYTKCNLSCTIKTPTERRVACCCRCRCCSMLQSTYAFGLWVAEQKRRVRVARAAVSEEIMCVFTCTDACNICLCVDGLGGHSQRY